MPIQRDDLETAQGTLERALGGASTGEAILNELTKSYGFGRNEDGSWDWSVERIGKALQDSPLTTTLDYLSLAVPVLKWGRAVAAVKAGAEIEAVGGSAARALGLRANVAQKALRAGEFAGQEATSRMGRLVGSAFGSEVGKAAETYLEGASPFVARLKTGRGTYRTLGISNPLGTELSDEYLQLLDRHGAEWWENRAVVKSLDRERQLEESYTGRLVTDTQKAYQRASFTPEELRRTELLQRSRIAPTDKRVARVLGEDPAKIEAYRGDFDFRMWLHGQLYDLGLTNAETYEAGLKKYGPNLSAEWERIKGAAQVLEPGVLRQIGRKVSAEGRAARDAVGAAEEVGGAVVEGASARLRPRRYTDAQFREIFDQVLDPRASLETLAGAAQLVARQRFAQGLAGSIVTKSSQELRELAVEIAAGSNPKLALLHGITPERLEAVQRVAGGLRRAGRQLSAEDNDLGVAFGWKRLDQLFEGARVPGYLNRIPAELRDRWIDPAAAEDVIGGLEFLSKPEGFGRFYGQVVNLFRASKTAYNPATHVRNLFGNAVFASLARGGAIKLAPLEGLASWRAGDETYQAWRAAVGAGASYDAELRTAIGESGIAAKQAGRQATALDWMGDRAFARALQGGAGRLEQLYRANDEVWSLDTFIELTRKYEKRGNGLEAARQLATRDLRKFTPNYGIQSDLGDILRKGIGGRKELAIPFASFTTESLRVWKNVLAERPHLAYLWNHVFESMGQTFGAMAGFNPQQLEEAKQALPEYQQGKKMMILPFNVDGAPRFLDLSYMVPLANLAEANTAEKTFFGQLYDVTANPLLSTAIKATTGQDPFTGKAIQPQFTERQLGIPVTSPGARKLVGLAEHMAAMMLPPLVPPGYAGTNLLELARGQRNPATDQPLEDGVLATIASNLAGFRTYKADVQSQVLNVRMEQRRANESMAQAWDRWEFARANGDERAMAAEQQRITQLRLDQGYSAGEASEYFAESAKKRGPLSNLSKRQKREIAARADRLGALSPEDEALRQQLGRAR